MFGVVALVAWMPVDRLASRPRSRGLRWIWSVLALVMMALLASWLPIGSFAAPLSLVLFCLAGMEVGEQAARHGSASRPTAAPGAPLHVLRWGSLGAAACASAVAVHAAAAMLALGHPC